MSVRGIITRLARLDAGPDAVAQESFAASPTGGALRTDGPYSIGGIFSTAVPIQIVALGRYQVPGNVLDHRVSLYAEGNPAALVTVTVPAAAPVNALGMQYVNVAPLALPAGTYRLASNENGDQFHDQSPRSFTAPIVGGVTCYDFGSDVYPANAGATAGTWYAGPGFKFTT